MRWPLCAYCHSVDAFAWEVVGSVAGLVAAAAAIIALLPRSRRHKEIPVPPGQAAAVVTPADTGTDAPVMVGEIPREPLGFQPRTDLLAALDTPGPGSRVVVVHALTGLRGVGKTHLAAAYARAKLAERWRLVAWIDAGDLGGILAGLAEVAAELGVGQPDAEGAARAVRRRLEIDGDRCLLVFDNAADPELVQPFIPATGAAPLVRADPGRPGAAAGRRPPQHPANARQPRRRLPGSGPHRRGDHLGRAAKSRPGIGS